MKKISIVASSLAMALVAMPSVAKKNNKVAIVPRDQVLGQVLTAEEQNKRGMESERLSDQAHFPGGLQALLEYLWYAPCPDESFGSGGIVTVNFIVEADGSIKYVWVEDGLPAFNHVAVDIVKGMPEWIPETGDSGKPERTQRMIQLCFDDGKVSLYNEDDFKGPADFDEVVLEPVKFTEIQIVDLSEVKNEVITMEELSEEEGPRVGVVCVDADDEPEAAPQRPEEVYQVVEQKASFPGGEAALMKFIAYNLRYPESAAEKCIQGRVIVKFVVEKDGSITQAQVVKGVDPDLDKEALRVVNILPKWNPGKNNGVPVRTWFILPLAFKLQE